MPLDFHKMHANGDDFVMVDARNQANPITSQLVRRLGDRHRGIGIGGTTTAQQPGRHTGSTARIWRSLV